MRLGERKNDQPFGPEYFAPFDIAFKERNQRANGAQHRSGG